MHRLYLSGTIYPILYSEAAEATLRDTMQENAGRMNSRMKDNGKVESTPNKTSTSERLKHSGRPGVEENAVPTSKRPARRDLSQHARPPSAMSLREHCPCQSISGRANSRSGGGRRLDNVS